MSSRYLGEMNSEWCSNVADVRKRLGLSQVAFAKELGTSQGVLSSWESGRNAPSYIFMARIVALDPEHRAIEEIFPVSELAY
jgi:DNA-binding transcriptional regulator YiaG